MANGARTRDLQDHNQTLCQLSYSHHARRNATVLSYDRYELHFFVAASLAALNSSGVFGAILKRMFR